jgi:thiol-disulfide isomerase/thioredoxin
MSTRFFSLLLGQVVCYFMCSLGQKEIAQKKYHESTLFVKQTQLLLEFSFNTKTSSIVHWDDLGHYVYMTNGKFTLDAELGYYHIDCSNDKKKITFLIPADNSITIKEEYPYFKAHTQDKTLEKELNFPLSYITDNQINIEPFLHKIALITQPFLEKPNLREDLFKKEYNTQIRYLQFYQSKHNLPNRFYELWEGYFFYKMLEKKLCNNSEILKKYPVSYKEELQKSVQSQNDKFLFLHNYQNAMLFLASILCEKDGVKEESLVAKCHVIAKYFRGKTRDWLLMKIIEVGHKKYTGTTDLKEALTLFNGIGTTIIFRDYIQSLISPKIVEKAPSGIAVEDVDKNQVQVWDLINRNRGRVVLIDFWATWCAPCLSEIPHSNGLKKQYPGLLILYLSLDENRFSWEKAMKRLGVDPAYSFIISKNHEQRITKHFGIKSIPHYVLIDRKGNIINANAPKPSSTELKTSVQKLLNKQ